MGGGKKKLTLAAMERAQEKKPEKKRDSKSSSSASERKIPDVFMPDTSGKIVDEMRKFKMLTPYVVSTRFNLRIGVAKDFLEELEKKGAVKLVSRSRNVRVYKPTD